MLYDVLTVLTVVSAQNTIHCYYYSSVSCILTFCTSSGSVATREWSAATFSAWLRRQETGNKIFAVRTGRKSSWN